MDLESLPLYLSWDLLIIGGASSNLAEFLRGLILKIEDYPRLVKSWKYVPALLGIVGTVLYPSAVQGSSTLIVLAHGALSPLLYYAAYPLIKKLVVKSPLPQLAGLLGEEKKEDHQ